MKVLIEPMNNPWALALVKGIREPREVKKTSFDLERVLSKSDERKARGRFEITSTISPCIVQHEVQLLINRIYNKFQGKKCLLRTFLSENVCSAFPKF